MLTATRASMKAYATVLKRRRALTIVTGSNTAGIMLSRAHFADGRTGTVAVIPDGCVCYRGRAFRDEILGRSTLTGSIPVPPHWPADWISLRSDYNVTQINPLKMVETAVTRVLNQGGNVLNPAERIPVKVTLKAVTLDAAWQCGMDDPLAVSRSANMQTSWCWMRIPQPLREALSVLA